jgi:hypothetical protein
MVLKLWCGWLRSCGLRILKGVELVAPTGRELRGLRGISLPLLELYSCIGL